MKRWLYTTAITLVLMIAGLVTVGFMQGRSDRLATQDGDVPTTVPTAVANLQDIQQVPLYANAVLVNTIVGLRNDKYVAYEVRDRPQTVHEFYLSTLPKKGWVLRQSTDLTSLHSWTDPAGNVPWGLFLELRFVRSLDASTTRVTMTYGRYPDIGGGLPTYSDAREVNTVRSEKKEAFPFDQFPIHVTDVTYLSSATPQQIADFYNDSMPEYGWYFFDRFGAGEVKTQTGDINSEEGLFFRSTRLGWDTTTSISYRLFVTATVQEDGQTLVKLHAEEQEAGGGP